MAGVSELRLIYLPFVDLRTSQVTAPSIDPDGPPPPSTETFPPISSVRSPAVRPDRADRLWVLDQGLSSSPWRSDLYLRLNVSAGQLVGPTSSRRVIGTDRPTRRRSRDVGARDRRRTRRRGRPDGFRCGAAPAARGLRIADRRLRAGECSARLPQRHPVDLSRIDHKAVASSARPTGTR